MAEFCDREAEKWGEVGEEVEVRGCAGWGKGKEGSNGSGDG